jgi:hypothetical protein
MAQSIQRQFHRRPRPVPQRLRRRVGSRLGFQPAPGGQSQAQSNRAQVQVTQPAPRILLNGKDVTGQTTTVVVGQQIALTVTGLNGVTVQSFSWTIPASPSYVYGFSNGQSGPPDANNGQNDPSTQSQGGVTYYYSQAGTSTVIYTVNTQYSAQATFIVVAPTYTIGWQKGTVGINPSAQQLQYGVDTPGMTLTGTITPPQGFGAGSQEWVQLVPSSTSTEAKKCRWNAVPGVPFIRLGHLLSVHDVGNADRQPQDTP